MRGNADKRWPGLVACVLALFSCALTLRAAAQQLTLHDAIQQALTSPQAQAAAAQVEQASGALRQSGLGMNPRLFLQSEDFRPWSSDYDFSTQTEDYGFLSQTFETGGKRRRRVDLATARLAQARSREQETRLAIAGRVATAYWNASVSERTVVLLGEDMNAVNDMVRYHQERVNAGAMRGVDLLRMQIERDRLLISLRSAERDAEQARLELFRQMGRPPLDHVQLTGALDQVTPIPATSLEAIMAQRADLVEARGAVASAQADVKLQRANAVPDLDLVGGYKRNQADNTGYAALQIPLPFHNRNQGEIERAQASVALARSNLAALELEVRAEVAQSEQNYKREQDIVTNLLPGMRQKAKENLQLMTEAYRIGGVDLLRFLDAERTEFDVEISALRSMAEFQQAAVRLQLSYGVQP